VRKNTRVTVTLTALVPNPATVKSKYDSLGFKSTFSITVLNYFKNQK